MEVWKDIKDYEGYYQCSNLGRIKSIKRKISNGVGRVGYRIMKEKILSFGKDSYGYLTVSLTKNNSPKTMRVHRLVWEYNNGEIPKNKVVDHIDNNPLNNKIENLQLLTHRNNIIKGTVDSRSKYSKYPNVSFRLDRKKFFGRVQIKGKSIITGHFDNEVDAYLSVLKLKKENDISI